ncbi:hypothetical protein WA1_01400 [Scytonema hofmannii PCC 7110]|uniref:Response regulatory domain-containing protein n=1 Tax=Scytonema hofmannii PCC 7110 TaxID=128403 RepID=A0A139XGP4_9CYAN|nr:hypothetical protein [Scytonema hofmannii]KYC43839.1 hypothetical protein WA1_01400 [Scytonema hofmannii PCC 7110]
MNQQQSLDAGGHDFLVKPVPAEELFKLLQKYLQIEWVYQSISTSRVKPHNRCSVKQAGYTPEEFQTRLAQLQLQKNIIETATKRAQCRNQTGKTLAVYANKPKKSPTQLYYLGLAEKEKKETVSKFSDYRSIFRCKRGG